jgi:hypothetical protein
MKGEIMRLKLVLTALIGMALFVASSPAASAVTTWYVNGANGSDGNSCRSAATACETIRGVLSKPPVSGDSIRIAPAVYSENLTINSNLTLIGSSARTTIIDGGHIRVISIGTSAHVTLANLTIRNGGSASGGGILNSGYLTLSSSAITGNFAGSGPSAAGGGISSSGTLTVNNSTFSGNTVSAANPGGVAAGGAIYATGPLVMNNSTVSGNSVTVGSGGFGRGGGIYTAGGAIISNTTVAGNSGKSGGGIYKAGGPLIKVIIQNSIVSGSSSGGNCFGTMTSHGYNLSSDGTCTFSNSGDLKKANPNLGPLQYNGGPTQTMALPSGSPAVDSGNPAGCTNNLGVLLKTDQRGMPRHDKEDTGGCDRGAYERQLD